MHGAWALVVTLIPTSSECRACTSPLLFLFISFSFPTTLIHSSLSTPRPHFPYIANSNLIIISSIQMPFTLVSNLLFLHLFLISPPNIPYGPLKAKIFSSFCIFNLLLFLPRLSHLDYGKYAGWDGSFRDTALLFQPEKDVNRSQMLTTTTRHQL